MYSTQQVEDGCEATAAIHIGFATYTQNLGISHSWSANQRRPHSAKKKVDDFLDKGTRRRLAHSGRGVRDVET